jgi:hypothetical protein
MLQSPLTHGIPQLALVEAKPIITEEIHRRSPLLDRPRNNEKIHADTKSKPERELFASSTNEQIMTHVLL